MTLECHEWTTPPHCMARKKHNTAANTNTNPKGSKLITFSLVGAPWLTLAAFGVLKNTEMQNIVTAPMGRLM